MPEDAPPLRSLDLHLCHFDTQRQPMRQPSVEAGLDSLSDVAERFLCGPPLREAPREGGTLCHNPAVFVPLERDKEFHWSPPPAPEAVRFAQRANLLSRVSLCF